MNTPSYIKMGEPYFDDGKMMVNLKLKRWGIFPIAWRIVAENMESKPLCLWPLQTIFYLYACFNILLFGWGETSP